MWFLAKVVPDLERNEPRNVGLVLRVAESDRLTYRFVDQVVAGAFGVIDAVAYLEQIRAWIDAMEKHGAKSLYWLPKRKSRSYYMELAGTVIKPGRVNFAALYERLVLSSPGMG